MKQLRVEAARKNFKFCRIEPALDPALPVLFGVDENGIQPAVKPVHIPPRNAFEKAVLGKNPTVLGKIGVVNAARLQVEHLGREQRSQSNGPGRADDNLGEFLALYVIQHLENRRETQFLQFVLGQFKFADGREISDRDFVNSQVISGGHDGELVASCRSGCGHFPNSSGYAVYVLERIREPSAFAILQSERNVAGQFLKNRPQPFSRGRLTVKAVDVRRKNYEDRDNRAKRLHALNHVAAAYLLNEFLEEAKRELLGNHVRHEKCTAFRLADSVQLRGEFRLYLWAREIT